MRKTQNIIAIDPDVDKNGVAFLECKTRKLKVFSLTFPELIDYLLAAKRRFEVTKETYRVIIEAGWLIRKHWHVNRRDNKAVAAAKGNHAGRNHETGRKIAEMCEHWQIPYELVRPLRKCWKGRDRKITHAEFVKFTKVNGRTNQEERDAGLIAWVFAELPIKIN